ncbi:MAG: peptide deformylase [Patescibacteria group bacterium]
MIKIITVPNPILRKIATSVTAFDGKLRQLLGEMTATLNTSGNPAEGIIGVGLAGPQIGQSVRIILVRKVSGRGEEGPVITLINPEIIKASTIKEFGYEGCLSVPNTYGSVERSKWIKVKAYNEKGDAVGFKAVNFFARIIQHEIDHLDGILFTDKVVGRLFTADELGTVLKE